MSGRWAGSKRGSQLPPDWSAIRRAVLERAGFRCQAIDDGKRCTAVATDCDHMRDPLDHRMSNLQALCHPHHARKTQAEALAGRLARSPRRPDPPHPGYR